MTPAPNHISIIFTTVFFNTKRTLAMNPYPNQVHEDLLSLEDIPLVRATTGIRFANYMIDIIAFYAFMFVIGIVLGLIDPTIFESMDNESPATKLVDRLLSLLLYGLFMGLVEGIFKGKSLGKLITGTRAVQLDGSAISFQTALLRGFSRAVPFAPFSAFGSPSDPWQDKWTKTQVVYETK
jgi:uncharacterized RDD family membrane protein YckC